MIHHYPQLQLDLPLKDFLFVLKYHLDFLLFDFVFLDGGHSPGQIINDLYAIRPFLEKEFVMVLHDYFENVFTDEVKNTIKFLFNIEPVIELEQPFGDNMAVIYNKKI